MTVPVDITDARLIKAYAHPLRLQILSLLDNRVASPKQIAEELDTPLPNTAYHVRQLASLGLVELVRRTARGGAIEHHYTARVRPVVPDDVWETLPEIVKRAYSGGLLQQAITQMVAAAEEDGFLAKESHFSRTPGRLDAKGWKAVSRELLKTLHRVERLVEESEARLAKNPDDESKTVNVVMAFFEQADPKAVEERRVSDAPSRSGSGRGRASRARASGSRSEPAA
ncbi:MAG TPA: helix-turn-helix domain-containing protein [Microvirga sp.]|nr:helix-turn-helix domain-containing protein [Microvirga sp.]